MARMKAPRPVSRREELRRDSATTLFARLQGAYVSNKRAVTYAGVGLVVVVVGIVGYRYLQDVRAAQAEEALGGILFTYEDGDYRDALDGSESAVGLVDIVERYGSTPAGRMARFYAGDALFRLGEVAAAAEMFDGVRGGDNLIGASALAGEAAQMEADGELERAARLYSQAASRDGSGVWAPGYLMSAARAYETVGNFDAAEDLLLEIEDRYGDAFSEDELAFLLARVRAHQRRAERAS